MKKLLKTNIIAGMLFAIVALKGYVGVFISALMSEQAGLSMRVLLGYTALEVIALGLFLRKNPLFMSIGFIFGVVSGVLNLLSGSLNDSFPNPVLPIYIFDIVSIVLEVIVLIFALIITLSCTTKFLSNYKEILSKLWLLPAVVFAVTATIQFIGGLIMVQSMSLVVHFGFDLIEAIALLLCMKSIARE